MVRIPQRRNLYASKEEKNKKDKHNQRSTDYSEDEGSESASNDGSSSDEVADVDEYAAFETDSEKYMYDLGKRNGIQNTRKYVPKKKKNEGEDHRKRKHNGEKAAKRPLKSRKVEQLNPLAQSSDNEEYEEEASTQDSTVQNEEEEVEKIDFDMIGNMWYEYHKDGIGKTTNPRTFC